MPEPEPKSQLILSLKKVLALNKPKWESQKHLKQNNKLTNHIKQFQDFFFLTK